MTKSSYLVGLTAALLLAGVGSPQLGSSNQSADPILSPSLVYDRARWKTKYFRPASIPFPADNQYSKDRELLGATLFFDPRLSGSRMVSCARCHNPGLSWGDGLPRGIGNHRKELARKTPTILNLAWADLLFWDGRAQSLEEQALGPIASPAEMNQPLDEMIAVVTNVFGYRVMFARAYPGELITAKTVARAIATFERTVVSDQAPFDQWVSGRESAIPEAAKRGFDLFNTKALCQKCHEGWNFTDNGFHDIGLSDNDEGRGAQLPIESMHHAFKTPTLRNSDRRAPYMHNGSEQSLADVIEYYNRGGEIKRPSLDTEIVPLHLTATEKSDLLDFLATLTSNDEPVGIPTLPR
jgi:cytochrome c peroxidase